MLALLEIASEHLQRVRNSQNFYPALAALFGVWVLSKVVEYRGKLQRSLGIPGFRLLLLHPMQLGAIFPNSWWNPGLAWHWNWRKWVYARYGTDTISFVPALLGETGFYTSNLDVIKQIAGGSAKTDFYKPEAHSGPLLFWGMNLFAAEGAIWKKHRRVLAPAFNASVYEMVWDESVKAYHDMVRIDLSPKRDGGPGKIVDVDVVQKLTFKLALFIIGKCAFGFNFSYADSPRGQGETMSLKEAFEITGNTNIFACFAPGWVKALPLDKCKQMKQAHSVVTHFIKEHITSRRQALSSSPSSSSTPISLENEPKDVFSMLLAANEAQSEDKLKLSEDELIGNVYIMLFAGHESTAHTLAATMALLAAHPEVQQEVYEEVREVLGEDMDPRVDSYPKLGKVLAAFYEALRMFNPAFVMIRQAKTDTTLQVPNPPGQEGHKTYAVPKGTYVMADMVGLQYNPRYYEDPYEYKPSRWYNLSNESEAFTGFSIGPRTCIGRKFATTEAVAFLSMLIRDYELRPLLSASKHPTVEVWKREVLEARFGITMGIRDVPVRFVRREGAI